MNSKVVVLDMHGIVFSFSPKGNVDESGEFLDKKVTDYSLKYPKFKDAMVDDSLYLAVELKIVKDILSGISDMGIFEMPNAVKSLFEYHRQGFKIVIVSTSKVETTKVILDYLFKVNNVPGGNQIIYDMDIYNTDDYGSKADVGVWQKIFSKYLSVDLVFEDKSKYLDAARRAALNLGFSPKCFSKI